MNPFFGLSSLAVTVGTILILYSAVQRVHLGREQSQELSDLKAVLGNQTAHAGQCGIAEGL